MSDHITITIRMNTTARFIIGSTPPYIIPSSTTVLQLKQIIAEEESCGKCPVERQRLIYKGRILNDNTRTLSDYGIVGSDQTIHLVKGSAPSSSSSATNSSTTSTATAAPSSTSSTTTPPFPNNFQEMQRLVQQQQQPTTTTTPDLSNPFQIPGAEQMQQQLLQNPEMTRSIMSSPMIQNLMSNPDFIRTMMDSNPQMRQVLDANPELRNILDDPETMRRSMEMMRDPNAMRNAMRNQDLAMSQIENIPGGFAALRRMYEDVQEPMMDAFAGGGGGGGATGGGGGGGASTTGDGSASSNSGSGAAGNAMPNPWSSGTSNAPTTTTTATGGMNRNPLIPPPSSNPMSMLPNPWAAGGGTGAAASGSSSGGGGGLGGGGFPMGGNPTNPMNLEQTISMLENPLVSQMMDQMMSDPATMQSLMDSNPFLRQMRETNPQVASMMSNPELMRSMMNPQNLRAMSQMQSAMQQLGGSMPGFPPMPNVGGMPGGWGVAPPSTNTNNTTTNNNNNNNNAGIDFSTLLNQLQSTSVSNTNTSNQQQVLPPEQRFHRQLQSLNDMGFDDNEQNIRALTETHGNVNRAIDYLFSNPSPTVTTPAANAEPSESMDASSSSPMTNESSADDGGSSDTVEGGDKKND